MKRDGRPEHQKIAAFYRSLIMSGDLAPGEQLPPVAQLMEHHGVAVHTIQRALNVLRGEGFTETKRGIGVFVRERALVVTEAIEYLALPNRLLDVGEVRPPADVAEVLGLEREATAAMRSRLLLSDDEPFELATSYYPVEIARGTGLASPGKIRGGAVNLLKQLGYNSVEFIDRVSVRLPTTQEFEVLELPDDIPVHRTFRTYYTPEGVPFEVTVMIQGGHLYGLQYRQPTRGFSQAGDDADLPARP
jgi:GntR family transcriptional regulator